MPRVSSAVTISVWEALIDGVKQFADELPHLQELQAELESTLTEARRCQTAYLRYHARAMQEARRMREISEKGQRIESRIRAGLKSAHGADSPKLIRYGLRPHKGMRKSAPREVAPAEPEIDEEVGETRDGEG
ncbi:MAG TPA: hypothetical protein VEL74_04295 [Thermoanaerobaculia bacterium]|nr:hypothetical protein [Thermoanaerobaculia bacterium]